jgi:serine/threonine protein phosphatase PrpC
MGDLARAHRADRFIQEFNEDWLKKRGYQFHNVVSQSLNYDEYSQVVRHYVTLKEINGDETLLMSSEGIFGPESDEVELLAAQLAEWLGQSRRNIIKRLKKADLWV